MRSESPINPQFFLDTRLRAFILGIMVIAFFFGFADQIYNRNFERLHIFLFNLCAGGFIILYHTENTARPSFRCYLFLATSLLYALLAFLNLYPPAALLSLFLGVLVETIRTRIFPVIPHDLFDPSVPVSDKYHHASILCLSLALFIATFVLLNSTALHWLPYKSLTLNVFFLGFSFPVSLITMSVMFSFIRRDGGPLVHLLQQAFFWLINLGVIVFFLFIIFEMQLAKVTIAVTLFLTVLLIFAFFLRLGMNMQQKQFLLSGMVFLVFTGITGIFYIILARYPAAYEQWGRLLLSCHAYLSLYGWSLSGLLILIRWNDFPLRLNSLLIIFFHWLVIGILAPIGKADPFTAVAAVICYCLFLHLFFAETKVRPMNGAQQHGRR